MNSISIRDQEEIRRSAAEAAHLHVSQVDLSRYLKPPADTAFPLEYIFHLLGDVRGKNILDLGCGAGENMVPLLRCGANVTGIDISPELIELARRRVSEDKRLFDADRSRATLRPGSAYETGFPDESLDVIFCIALVHHLEIPKVRDEMLRILKPGGCVLLKEPIRFSPMYARARSWLPAREDISEYEHPLTRAELSILIEGFSVEASRCFRLPFVPLLQKVSSTSHFAAMRWSDRILRRWPALTKYATSFCARLVKPSPVALLNDDVSANRNRPVNVYS